MNNITIFSEFFPWRYDGFVHNLCHFLFFVYEFILIAFFLFFFRSYKHNIFNFIRKRQDPQDIITHRLRNCAVVVIHTIPLKTTNRHLLFEFGHLRCSCCPNVCPVPGYLHRETREPLLGWVEAFRCRSEFQNRQIRSESTEL